MDDAAQPDGMVAWLEATRSPTYWIDLNPELTIGGPPAGSLFTVDTPLRHDLWNQLLTDGYFHLPPALPPDQVARMVAAMTRLVAAHIPVVFIYVYDEPWNLSGQLSELLGALLGPGFRMQPDFWAWWVDPRKVAEGWPPHRDKGFETLQPNGQPRSLSIWVPLTDATPENGCIYVLPACRDSNYLARDDEVTFSNLQDVRALPARAGSILGWNQTLLHWGGRSSDRSTTPRISFSIEYQRGDCQPFHQPLIDPSRPPPFEQRLALIGEQILQYEHMYELEPDLAALAERLIQGQHRR